MSETVDTDIEALESGTGSCQGKRLIPDSLYMPDLSAPWRKCTVYTSMNQNEFRMYEMDPSDPDGRETFLLSAKIYENEGAYISISESFPSEIIDTSRNSLGGVEQKDGEDDIASGGLGLGLGVESSGARSGGTKSRCGSEELKIEALRAGGGAELFAQQKGGYIAKLERQVDNSFLLCLNTCRYCDYEHSYYKCSSSVSEREIGLRVKHSIKKSKFTGDTEIKFVNVLLPAFVPTSISPVASISKRVSAKPGTKRAIWCPRTFKNSVYSRDNSGKSSDKDNLGSNVDFETSSVASRRSNVSRGSAVSGRSGKPLGPHRQSSFENQTMNELVLGHPNVGQKCMSKIPDWNPKINSLVTKFHDNRIRFPSSHNVIIYEESTLQEYKSVLKTAVTAAAVLKEQEAPQPDPPKSVVGKDASPFGKLGNFFSRREKEPAPPPPPPPPLSAPEIKTVSTTLSADRAIFQFGKNSERSEEYALDFRGPLSPLQAFAVAMSSFSDDMVANYISLDAIAQARAKKKTRRSVSSTGSVGGGGSEASRRSLGGSPTSASSRKSSGSDRRRSPKSKHVSGEHTSGSVPASATLVTIFVPGAKPIPPPPLQGQNSGGSGSSMEKKSKRRPSITDMFTSLTSSSSSSSSQGGSASGSGSAGADFGSEKDALPSDPSSASTTKPKRRPSLTSQLFASLSPSSATANSSSGFGRDSDGATAPEKKSWTSKMFGVGSAEKVAPPPPPPPPATISGPEPSFPPALSVDTRDSGDVSYNYQCSAASTPLTSSSPLVRIPNQGDVFRAHQAARLRTASAGPPGVSGAEISGAVPLRQASSLTAPSTYGHSDSPNSNSGALTADNLPRPNLERSRSNSISSTSSGVSYRSNLSNPNHSSSLPGNQNQASIATLSLSAKQFPTTGGQDISGSSSVASSSVTSAPVIIGAKTIPPVTAAYMEKRRNLASIANSVNHSRSSSFDGSVVVAGEMSSLTLSGGSGGDGGGSDTPPVANRNTPPATPSISRKASPAIGFNTGPSTITTAGGIKTPTKNIHHPPIRSGPSTPTPPTRRQAPLTSPIVRARTGANPPVACTDTESSPPAESV